MFAALHANECELEIGTLSIKLTTASLILAASGIPYQLLSSWSICNLATYLVLVEFLGIS